MTDLLNHTETAATRQGVVLRPGVTLPDWSVVSSPVAEAALAAIFDAFGVASRWDGRSVEEDRVHRAVLRAWGRLGHAPEIRDLAVETGLSPEKVGVLLGRLRTRDLVVLNESGDAIAGAYPFTESETGHRVRVGAQWLNAMCAIDALGVGAMFGNDTRIETSCRACGAPIHIEIRGDGERLGAVSGDGALVWSGVRYDDGCAATSLCTVLAFFCSEEHLESWRAEHEPETKGYILSLEEGLQAGRSLFGPFLAEGEAGSNEKGNEL